MLYYKHTQITEEIMSRINKEKLKNIANGMNEAKQRQQAFKSFLKNNPRPDASIKKAIETQKGVSLVRNMITEGYNSYDALNHYGEGAISSKNDTHSVPRKWELFFGGRGDNKPSPDTKHCEIKFNEAEEKHVLPSDNPVLNIGAIQPKKAKDYKTFEESSVFKKMENMWITTHSNDYQKIEGTFVFRVDNPLWFDRVKEDFEFYLKLHHKRRDAGLRSSKSSIISYGVKSPNGTLVVRSNSIMMTGPFFKEASEHYDK
jgi:hypothetical protein